MLIAELLLLYENYFYSVTLTMDEYKKSDSFLECTFNAMIENMISSWER